MSKLTLPEDHPYHSGRVCTTCDEFKTADNYKLERDVRAFKGVTMRSKCRKCDEHRKWKRHITKTYGISPEQYYEMLALQNNSCKICDSEYNNSGRCESGKFFVDHCHTTGKVRGLLCSRCNNGLGLFNDDTDRLQRAIGYLKQFERKNHGSSSIPA